MRMCWRAMSVICARWRRNAARRVLTVLAEEQIAGAFGRQARVYSDRAGILAGYDNREIECVAARMDEMLERLRARFADENGVRWAAMARGVGVIYFALLPGAHATKTRRSARSHGDE